MKLNYLNIKLFVCCCCHLPLFTLYLRSAFHNRALNDQFYFDFLIPSSPTELHVGDAVYHPF